MEAEMYRFSEPFHSRFIEVLKGIRLPDRRFHPSDLRGNAAPITEGQVGYLRKLGYGLEFPKTKHEASIIIGQLTRERKS